MRENKVSVDKWLEKQITFSLRTGLIILVLSAICFFLVKTVNQRVEDQKLENDTTGLEISSLIRNVKYELIKADQERISKNEHALFKLNDFAMEITFTVRKVNKTGAKVDYKFVSVEGGTESGNEKVQKLILHWDAIEPRKDSLPATTRQGRMIIKQTSKPKPDETKKHD